jgi:phage gp36-like protein
MWATQADLEARYGAPAIADLVLGGAIVADAIADAEAEAGGWIGRVATLPLTVVPDTLKRIVCTIARYNLWRRDLPEDHPVYIAYRDSRRELEAIAAGRIALPTGSGSSELTPEGSGAVVISSTRVFTDTFMAGAAL